MSTRAFKVPYILRKEQEMNYTKLFLIGLLMASTGLLKEHEEEDDIEMEEEEVARVLEIPIRAL